MNRTLQQIAYLAGLALKRPKPQPKHKYCPDCKSHGWIPFVDRSEGRNTYRTKPCPKCSTPKE